ncbi:MAG TPA: hypothetical protein VEL76_32590 [Gemmataceae bacterium]|nr:hypothetical protein [Gemmataceae bacterium]
MMKEIPLVHRIYFLPEYTAVARAIGYRGMTYRELTQVIEELAKQFPKAMVESAIYHLTTFEGQMTCNPPPLAKVQLREHARKLCWMLLGPPPEAWQQFYENVREPPDNPYVKAPEPKAEPPAEKPGKPQPNKQRTKRKKD